MTQTGEHLTLKGVFNTEHENVYAFHKSIGISYSMDIGKGSQKELKMAFLPASDIPFFQMIFVMKGKIALKKTELGIECSHMESQQHNLYLIRPTDTSMMLSSPDDEIICINLSRTFLSRYLPDSHSAWLKFKDKTNDTQIPTLSSPNMYITPEISAILQRMEQNSGSSFCDQLVLESKVIELLALQITQSEQLKTAEQPIQLKNGELDKMLEAREILIHHTGEQLSLKSLAHMVGTNEFNLKRNFKIAFGNTVYGYLNEYKMQQAKAMLIDKDITIAEVALKMGYKYATHFSSAFKKYFGYLPNKIRSGKLSLLIFLEDFSVAFENITLLMG